MPKVTYSCVDCGKERTNYAGHFSKPREEYRCYSCAAEKRCSKQVSKRVIYTCINCGKESRSDYKNHFSTSREEYRCSVCAANKRSQNPKWIENQKRARKDPVWKENNERMNQRKVHDPVYIENHKRGIQKRSHNPAWRENVTKANQKKAKDPACIENRKKGIEKRSQNPEWQKMMVEQNQKMYQDPVWIENQKSGVQRSAQGFSWRESNLIALTGEGFWYGHRILRGNNRKIYCEKWNPNLWKRIDAAWDYKSTISGKTKFDNKGKHLSRHHVYWQEKACCVWDEDVQGYYAMINIGTFFHPTFVKYYIKGSPNKFVLLTVKEHSIIKGKKKLGTNILTWIKFFENIIEQREKEGKKCYLSPEEYEVYKIKNVDIIKQYTKK